MLENGNRLSGRRPRLLRGAAVLALLAASLPAGAMAAQRNVPRIDGFGPYKLGMSLADARAANKGATQVPCGDIADDRQCLKVGAAVFEEPAVIYAVLDKAGARVDRIVARMDPQLTRRRAYRCVRLSEKVFALLVVVYGPKYKQSYDENRRPLPAVAWDAEEAGRLIFETRCKTPDEGNPRITVLEHYPEGVKPPPVAKAPAPEPKVAAAPPVPPSVDVTAPGASMPLATDGQDLAPPPPHAAPVGVVEEIQAGAPDTSGAIEADAAMTALTRELAHAKGMAPPSMMPPPEPDTAAAPSPAVPEAAAPTGAPGVAAEPPAQAARDTTAPEPAPGGADGRYAVAVDIAPAPAAPAAQAAPEPSRTQVAERAPEPEPAVVDPGPVRIPARAAAVATAQPARTPPAAPPAEPASPAAQAAPATAAPSAATDKSRPQALAYATPARKPAAAAAGRTQPWPGRQTAIVPPAVRPPNYDAPGAYPEPTDLEAPEPFTVPEEDGLYGSLAPAETAQTAPPPALAMRNEARASETIEAEVTRRLAAAPVPYATTSASARPPETAPVPTSLLSEAGREDKTGQPAAIGRPVATPVAPPAPTPVAKTAPPDPQARSATVAALPDSAGARPQPAAGDTAMRVAEAPAPDAAAEAEGWGTARIVPVMTGGWRHPGPVPPAKPWRQRDDLPDPALSGG